MVEENKVAQIGGSGTQSNSATIKADSGVQVVTEINRDFKERSVQEKAKELGLSYVNLSKVPINPELLYLLRLEDAEKGEIFPFFRIGKRLRVALLDPKRVETVAIIQRWQSEGYQVNLNLATSESLAEALKLYDSAQYHLKKEIKNEVDTAAIEAYEKEIQNLGILRDRIGTMNSEDALNLINVGAFKTGASDIHFQPEETFVELRFRIDGLLQAIFSITPKIFENIANQLKYKAKMKLNINNIPQDGRYSFQINENKIDVRVNSLPTEFGEAFVCRLLNRTKNLYDFESLGFQGGNLEKVRATIGLSHGMILVTGPTGSGKTTTLYSMLGKYNTPEKKIITLEDPIEYNIENVTQSQINQKRDYTFASGLRAILRQDPDIVMIGEIRDLETAETAAQAALTGHVVLSTLHTNSAIETIPRLVNMGLPEFVIAPALDTVIAQRLVRKICSSCVIEIALKPAERQEIEKVVIQIQKIDTAVSISIPDVLRRGQGCDICSHSGYKGQISITEIVYFDEELKDLVLNKSSVNKLLEAARRKKMLTMEEDGILKVLSGITTLDEVHRVTRVL